MDATFFARSMKGLEKRGVKIIEEEVIV